MLMNVPGFPEKSVDGNDENATKSCTRYSASAKSHSIASQNTRRDPLCACNKLLIGDYDLIITKGTQRIQNI